MNNQNLSPRATPSAPLQTPLLPWSAVLPLNLQPFKTASILSLHPSKGLPSQPSLHHILAFISSQPPSTNKQSSEVWISLSNLVRGGINDSNQLGLDYLRHLTCIQFLLFVYHYLGWNSFHKIWKYWKLKSMVITLKLTLAWMSLIEKVKVNLNSPIL